MRGETQVMLVNVREGDYIFSNDATSSVLIFNSPPSSTYMKKLTFIMSKLSFHSSLMCVGSFKNELRFH